MAKLFIPSTLGVIHFFCKMIALVNYLVNSSICDHKFLFQQWNESHFLKGHEILVQMKRLKMVPFLVRNFFKSLGRLERCEDKIRFFRVWCNIQNVIWTWQKFFVGEIHKEKGEWTKLRTKSNFKVFCQMSSKRYSPSRHIKLLSSNSDANEQPCKTFIGRLDQGKKVAKTWEVLWN